MKSNKSLTPAFDQAEENKKREAIELCGKNRGPHDYIPIEWLLTSSSKRVSRLLCRTCFNNISVHVLIERYSEITV